MPFAAPSRVCLGIDLVELKRARLFYHRHRHQLESFFTKKEISYIGHRTDAYKKLAELLAAKEAVFKASGKAWMGPQGFRKKLRKQSGLKINLKINKKYVVAQCVGI